MTKPLFRHTAYGLTIHSEIELPELLPSDNDVADLVIRCGRIERDLPVAAPGTFFEFSRDVQVLDWAAVGKFEIRGTSEIVVDARDDVPEKIVRLPLLGPVMAMWLHVRGLMVLHASAVLINGKGAGFLGDKRAGKSTTAGALVGKGYPLLTDDVLAFDFKPEVRILPGFPQMKLTDESAATVAIEKAQPLERIDVPGFDKRQHSVSAHFSNDYAVPGRLYVLERGPDAQVVDLSPVEAFRALMRFSYLIRFGKEALSAGNAPGFMQQCAHLAELGVVRRLIVPDSLERLGEAVVMIEHDLG